MTGFTSLLLHYCSWPIVQAIGRTILHSLWEGAVIAAMLAGVLRLLRGAAPGARYAASCAALGVMLLAALATFALSFNPGESMRAPSSAMAAPAQALSHPMPPAAAAPVTVAPISSNSGLLQACLAGAWLAGIAVLGFWHLGGWVMLAWLRRGERFVELEPRFFALMQRLGIRRRVRLRRTRRLDVPAVIGTLRPVVLLPAALMNDLSLPQIEAILAHELAHIRRQDYLVNLIQTAIETVLFYHPATWWISSQIRRERENCCDDVAAETCGDRKRYAQALAAIEKRRARPMDLVPAATGASLRDRIRRLLGLSPVVGSPSARARSIVTAIVVMACILAPVGLTARQSFAEIPHPATTSATTQSGPITIKINVGERSLIYEGKPVSFDELTTMLERIPGVHQRSIAIEVTAASPDIKVERYFSAFGQIAGLINRFHVTSLTRGGVAPTTDPDTAYLPPGTEIGEYYISGVKRDGVYSLTARKISLKQALIAAGGTAIDPANARVRVIRNPGPDEKIIADDLSVDDLMNERVKDFFLRANDIIQVRAEKAQSASGPPIPGDPKNWTVDEIAAVDPAIRTEVHFLSSMKSQLADLKRRLGNQHPEVTGREHEIEQFQKKVSADADAFRQKYALPSTRP